MIRSKDQVDEIAATGLDMAKRFAGISPLHAELLQGAEFRKADITFEKEHTLDLGGVSAVPGDGLQPHARRHGHVRRAGHGALLRRRRHEAAAAVGAGASLSQWIASQDRLAALAPARVVPSHGAMGDASIMADTKRFVSTVRSARPS